MGKLFGSTKRSDSWNVAQAEASLLQTETSSYKKFKLLLWKNWKIQSRHHLQTFAEITLPLLFVIFLVITRHITPSIPIPNDTIYTSFELDIPPTVVRSKCNEIYYTPKNPLVDSLMERIQKDYFSRTFLFDHFNYTFKGFESEKDLLLANAASRGELKKDEVTGDLEVAEPVLAGIVFTNSFPNGSFPKDIKYSLRFPANQRSEFDIITERFGIQPNWFTEIVYPLVQLLGPRSAEKNRAGLPGYDAEGFLYLQYALDATITNFLLNQTLIISGDNSTQDDAEGYYDKHHVRLQRFPYPAYIDDKFLFAMQGWLPLVCFLSFLYPVINITKAIVYEKEKRLKESMKMMGLPNWSHWLAWFIKSVMFLTVSVIIMTVFIKIKFSESQSLAIMPYTNGYVLFLVLFTYTLSVITYCFFISTLFSGANAGAIVSGFIFFIQYVPYAFIQPRYNLLTKFFKMASGFGTNTPIAFACQIIIQFEGISEGLQWHNLYLSSSPDDDFSVLDCMIMMGVNSILYLLLALYIEAVRPGDYGIAQPWYFFLTKWYWTGQPRFIPNLVAPEPNQTLGESYFEKEMTNSVHGIQIRNLSKSFGEKMAVNNMCLNMHQDQITALLGHNGAGKTTTMSILTGLFPPSSGTAIINGFDICKDIGGVRSSLGLCPQHDVLFDELTVEEHLKFFCLMKGFPDESVPGEIDRMLEALGLEDKRKAQAHTLSGGMRRKLSVGIALCGGSKVVLLDEPTSGMDPGARRSTWDLIQTEKKGRTILLSTHFMEEADLLGDRIAIMAEGEVQCCGSSLFLKKKYGGGYHLIIVKHPGSDIDKITQVLAKTIPEVEVESNVGAELSYSLPDQLSALFPAMFEELEKNKTELGIASYGASITTMEEVFIRVGREAEAKITAAANIQYPRSSTEFQVNIDGVENELTNSRATLYQDNPLRNTGLTLILQQLWAMLVKKGIYAFRNRILLIFQLAIPVIYLVIVLIVLSTLPGFTDPPPQAMDLHKYEHIGKAVTTLICPNSSDTCTSLRNYFHKQDLLLEEVNAPSLNNYILQRAKEDLVRVNFKYIVGFEERPLEDYITLTKSANETQIVGFFNNQPLHTPPLALNLITNSILGKFTDHSIEVTNSPFPFGGFENLKTTGSAYTIGFQVGYNVSLGMATLVATFVVFLINERESKSKHIQFVSGIEYPLFWFASFVVDLINYLIPCILIIIALLIFKTEDFQTFEMNCYIMVLMIAYGFGVIPLMYLWSFSFTVPTTGFTRMALFNIFTGLATMFTVALLQIPELGTAKVADFLNNIFLIFPNYALGMGLVYLSSNYKLHKECSTINLEFFCDAWEDNFCCDKLQSNYLDWKPVGIGRNLVYLVCCGVISIIILFLAESKILKKVFGVCRRTKQSILDKPASSEGSIAVEDEDVSAENARIRKTQLNDLFQEENLIMRDLTKYYDGFLAVDHLNLGIKRGETFGLLGINGAGKTTTFKMLTGDLPLSSGDAFIYGKSVRSHIKEIHTNVGYCPQFNALIDEMTGRETIRMYARLRGIKESEIDGLVDRLGRNLLFNQYMDKLVSGYSGGNKRKLSTALALVGNPPIVFLDEPTTGMDPVARRHLWNAISIVREAGTSIILTSHSMEECEVLCSRLAIMVNGKFRCLGSSQQLKSKFGEGYTLIAQKGQADLRGTKSVPELTTHGWKGLGKNKVTPAWEKDLEELRDFIEGSFPGCILKDIHPGFVQYQVFDQDVTWGQMFQTMEVAKDKFNLEAYSVGQTTLEQVFLNFTKAQLDFEIPKKKGWLRLC